MASTFVTTTATEDLDVGNRRSRLSFHFNTRKWRRWLLVQLVSMPVEKESVGNDENAWQAPQVAQKEQWADSYSRLLNNYETNFHLTRPR
jgi:hypothetical protein